MSTRFERIVAARSMSLAAVDRDLEVSRFAAMSKFARAALTLFARNVPDEEVALAGGRQWAGNTCVDLNF